MIKKQYINMTFLNNISLKTSVFVAQKFFMFSQISQLSLHLLRHQRQMLSFKNNLSGTKIIAFGYIIETKIGRAIHASI